MLSSEEIDRVGKQLCKRLLNGTLSYEEMVEKFFVNMDKKAKVDYNNKLIRAINSHMPEGKLHLMEYFGLITCR